ncbi:hypothetical protein M1614_00635 [Candidatus Marsarchaeota archaeon]|nr:hypothetical protein [Candidatus Marsarchaeota archaeon]MCL5090005.1 hypothetical protein [Candidatus Marsarchaeota archaeon]
MTKIYFSPIQEVVIHEIVSINYDDLLRERITPSGNMPLYWCDGILFSFSSMPMTRDIIKEYLAGRIHWMEVHYTKMENYTPILELNDNEYKALLKIRVIDTSLSLLHKDFIKWLKSQIKE